MVILSTLKNTFHYYTVFGHCVDAFVNIVFFIWGYHLANRIRKQVSLFGRLNLELTIYHFNKFVLLLGWFLVIFHFGLQQQFGTWVIFFEMWYVVMFPGMRLFWKLAIWHSYHIEWMAKKYGIAVSYVNFWVATKREIRRDRKLKMKEVLVK